MAERGPDHVTEALWEAYQAGKLAERQFRTGRPGRVIPADQAPPGSTDELHFGRTEPPEHGGWHH